jgi:hypothetical protein
MDDAVIDKRVILGLDYQYLFKGKSNYKEFNNLVSGYNTYENKFARKCHTCSSVMPEVFF